MVFNCLYNQIWVLLAENDAQERKKYYVGIRGIRFVLYCINKLLNFYFATLISSLEIHVKRVYGPISSSNRPSLPKRLAIHALGAYNGFSE